MDEIKESFEHAVAYLEDTPRFTKKNSLDHTRRLLSCLGNPERSFKVIHVAGTNGKGSTCAFLDSALRESGYRVGLFTSPHLVNIRERFQIDGVMVDEEAFTEAFCQVKALALEQEALGVSHPTYFEMLFLMGMLLFRKAGAEIVVLETGLGGRLDATSAIEDPVLCVITSISLDHQEYLGDTIEKIAAEKAGIMVPGVPVVFDANDPAAGAVIRREAARLGCPACCPLPGEIRLPFSAPYQARNAALASKALMILQKHFSRLSPLTIQSGLSKARWPGRMEWLMPGVLIDGAHNIDGIRQLSKAVAIYLKQNKESLGSVSLLFSAVSDKAICDMIHVLAGELPLSKVMVTQVGGSRCVSTKVLRELFEKEGILAAEEPDPGRAFRLSLADREEGQVLLCTGSLYLVGEIIKYVKGGSQP